jgi:hypothetical protein
MTQDSTSNHRGPHNEIVVKNNASAIYRLVLFVLYAFLGIVFSQQDIMGYFFPKVMNINRATYEIIRPLVFILGSMPFGKLILVVEPHFLRILEKQKSTT